MGHELAACWLHQPRKKDVLPGSTPGVDRAIWSVQGSGIGKKCAEMLVMHRLNCREILSLSPEHLFQRLCLRRATRMTDSKSMSTSDEVTVDDFFLKNSPRSSKVSR